MGVEREVKTKPKNGERKANVKIKLLGKNRLIILPFISLTAVTFVLDALHKKSFNVARRSHHEVWSVIAYRSKWHNFGLLRWVDRWTEIPGWYGWLCGQCEFSFISAKRKHAIQARLWRGWLPKEFIALESDWNRTDGYKLHAGKHFD